MVISKSAMTLKEAGELLHCSGETIRSWCLDLPEHRRLRFHRVGPSRRLLVEREDLWSFLDREKDIR